jgi:hypothetical protein
MVAGKAGFMGGFGAPGAIVLGLAGLATLGAMIGCGGGRRPADYRPFCVAGFVRAQDRSRALRRFHLDTVAVAVARAGPPAEIRCGAVSGGRSLTWGVTVVCGAQLEPDCARLTSATLDGRALRLG